MRKSGVAMGEVQEWRDLATTRGQRYWLEVCDQERRIRGDWLNEYDARRRVERAGQIARANAPLAEPLATSISLRTGLWETRPMPRPYVGHRMGAAPPVVPLSEYEIALRDLATKSTDSTSTGGRELRMSRMSSVGDLPRPSTHHFASDAIIRARELQALGTSSSSDLRLSAEHLSEFERSLALRRTGRRSSSNAIDQEVRLLSLTAEERRQGMYEGAAGKPHRRDFAGMHKPPPPFDRHASAPNGFYRPTEGDMTKLAQRQIRAKERLRAELDGVVRELESADAKAGSIKFR